MLIKLHRDLVVGDRVQAKIRVYDLPGENFGPPHPRTVAKYGAFAAHIHAEPGELGIVADRDGERVTVTFDRTGTTSDVVSEEVEHVPAEWCMHHWKNVLHNLSPYAEGMPWPRLGAAARALGYFYYVWNGRVLISKAAEHRPRDSWPTIEEFFGKD